MEEMPDVTKFKELDNIKMEEIDDQIKIRQFLFNDMVGNLYPSILKGEISKLKIMKRYPVDTKVEGGFLYYKDGKEWKMAGREDHPLTQKFFKEVKQRIHNKKLKGRM